MMLDTKNEQMCPLLEWNRKKPSGKGHIYFCLFSVAPRCGFYFLPKERAQMAAVRGTASMTPMELATAEMASRLM